jgi:hypothetical protein
MEDRIEASRRHNGCKESAPDVFSRTLKDRLKRRILALPSSLSFGGLEPPLETQSYLFQQPVTGKIPMGSASNLAAICCGEGVVNPRKMCTVRGSLRREGQSLPDSERATISELCSSRGKMQNRIRKRQEQVEAHVRKAGVSI